MPPSPATHAWYVLHHKHKAHVWLPNQWQSVSVCVGVQSSYEWSDADDTTEHDIDIIRWDVENIIIISESNTQNFTVKCQQFPFKVP